MEIQEIYDTIQQYIGTDTDLTEDYMNRINMHFNAYLKNPTDKQKDTFKDLRDALIAMWLADLIKKILKQMKTMLKYGTTQAKDILKATAFKKIVKKAITSDKIKNIIEAGVESAITDIQYISNGIKVNSDRAIRDIQENITQTKKVISTQLAEEFSAYGITYFTDTAGRRQNITSYINKKSFDIVMNAFRDAYLAELVANGVEFVRVQRLPSLAKECNLCIKYDGKILSINDNVEGFESISESRMNGLWHFYCQHYVIPVQGEFTEEERTIYHTEENKKFKERNIQKGVKKGLLS